VIVSAIVALLAWRGVSLGGAATVTPVVALVLVFLQAWYDARHPDEVVPSTPSRQPSVSPSRTVFNPFKELR
jgi:hypothetical protein